MATPVKCRRCGASFTFDEGAANSREHGIADKVLACPGCHSVYEADVTPQGVTLLADVTSRFPAAAQAGSALATSAPAVHAPATSVLATMGAGATFKCRRCEAAFTYDDGAGTASDNGIQHKVLMCPTCFSVYQPDAMPAGGIVLEDVTGRFHNAALAAAARATIDKKAVERCPACRKAWDKIVCYNCGHVDVFEMVSLAVFGVALTLGISRALLVQLGSPAWVTIGALVAASLLLVNFRWIRWGIMSASTLILLYLPLVFLGFNPLALSWRPNEISELALPVLGFLALVCLSMAHGFMSTKWQYRGATLAAEKLRRSQLLQTEPVARLYRNTVEAWAGSARRTVGLEELIGRYQIGPGSALRAFFESFVPLESEFLVDVGDQVTLGMGHGGWFVLTNLRLFQKHDGSNGLSEITLADIDSCKVQPEPSGSRTLLFKTRSEDKIELKFCREVPDARMLELAVAPGN